MFLPPISFDYLNLFFQKAHIYIYTHKQTYISTFKKQLSHHISLSLKIKKERKHRSTMCPMRVFLVFFSAILAGYITWKSMKTAGEIEDTVLSDDLSANQQESSIIKVIIYLIYRLQFSMPNFKIKYIFSNIYVC